MRRASSVVSLTADGSVHGGSAHGGSHHHGRSRAQRYAEAEAQEVVLELASAEEGQLNPLHVVVRQGDDTATAAWEPKGQEDGRNGVQHQEGEKQGGGGGGGGVAPAHVAFVVEEAPDRQYWDWGVYFTSLPKKLKGGLDTPLPVPPLRDLAWSWIGAFLGILAVSALNQWVTPEINIALMVGSFGASAVLCFGVVESKLAQPRNFLGGQMLSALVGTTVRVVIPLPWIASPVAMSLALTAMQLTATTHPPGGATALIIASMSELPKWHGYSYLITIAVGSLVMQCIALVVNNLDPGRRYPTYWW